MMASSAESEAHGSAVAGESNCLEDELLRSGIGLSGVLFRETWLTQEQGISHSYWIARKVHLQLLRKS